MRRTLSTWDRSHAEAVGLRGLRLSRPAEDVDVRFSIKIHDPLRLLHWLLRKRKQVHLTRATQAEARSLLRRYNWEMRCLGWPEALPTNEECCVDEPRSSCWAKLQVSSHFFQYVFRVHTAVTDNHRTRACSAMTCFAFNETCQHEYYDGQTEHQESLAG